MLIREERPGDGDAIHAVTHAAFDGKPYSSATEAAIVEALRAAGALTISLVADDGGVVVGHIAFSPVTVDGAHGGWYGLGPVSVWPDRQGAGIGSALVEEGLERLRVLGASGCVLVGAPAFYARFGFRTDARLRYAEAPAAYFQVLPFGDAVPTGQVAYHEGFSVS